MSSNLSQFLLILLLLTPLFGHAAPVQARCPVNAADLYAEFKQYREHLNSASRLKQLTPYFSNAFNQYYSAKLMPGATQGRYLTHYWDNLNTAKDIVIIYQYTVQCANHGDNATLTLLAILEQPFSEQGSTTQTGLVDLWEVSVHYVKQGRRWLIDSFEYIKSPSEQTFTESQIVDNFAVIR